MKNKTTCLLACLMLLFIVPSLNAQNITLLKGAVKDSVPINDSISESFAIYLPKDYNSGKKWPIVFVFDPDGKGLNVTRLFLQALEGQNFIIASSNNISRKDSLLINLEKATRLFNKVLTTFPIDEKAIYSAGLDEGALVASAMPAIISAIDGVLAVEDVWVNSEFLVQNLTKHTVIGFVDNMSNSKYEFREKFRLLNSFKYPAYYYEYDGNGTWPSSNLIAHAMGGFKLQKMLNGGGVKDPVVIDNLFKSELETAESWYRKMDFYKANELLDLMLTKYKYFDKKDEIKDLQKKIRKEKGFKQQRSLYNSAEALEREMRIELTYLLQEDFNYFDFENLGWWSQKMNEIDELKKSKNPAEADMGNRLEDYLQTYAHNKFYNIFSKKNASLDQKIFTAVLTTIFDREDPEAYFSIISLSAQDGDYYTALLYLEDLLKVGYKDLEALYDIPETLDLKLSPEFNKLIKKYLGTSKYYNIPN
tara:strand:+ start:73199 stop:74629 length:1431 start_codon:yes stop_codon:yes gene_type:complete